MNEELIALAEPEWREWTGGKQPVANLRRVDARMRDGREYTDFAGCFRWEQGTQWHPDSDLVAWRPALRARAQVKP